MDQRIRDLLDNTDICDWLQGHVLTGQHRRRFDALMAAVHFGSSTFNSYPRLTAHLQELMKVLRALMDLSSKQYVTASSAIDISLPRHRHTSSLSKLFTCHDIVRFMGRMLWQPSAADRQKITHRITLLHELLDQLNDVAVLLNDVVNVCPPSMSPRTKEGLVDVRQLLVFHRVVSCVAKYIIIFTMIRTEPELTSMDDMSALSMIAAHVPTLSLIVPRPHNLIATIYVVYRTARERTYQEIGKHIRMLRYFEVTTLPAALVQVL
jgi:hypothetical protein